MDSSSSRIIRVQPGKVWPPFKRNGGDGKSAETVMIPTTFAEEFNNPPVLSYKRDALLAMWYRLTHNSAVPKDSITGVKLSDGSICFRLATGGRTGLRWRPRSEAHQEGRGNHSRSLHIVAPPDGSVTEFGAFLITSEEDLNPPYYAERPRSVILSADATTLQLTDALLWPNRYKSTVYAVTSETPTETGPWLEAEDILKMAKPQIRNSLNDQLAQTSVESDDKVIGEDLDQEASNQGKYWDEYFATLNEIQDVEILDM